MSRAEAERLDDIESAITAVRAYHERGTNTDGLVFDAIRMRLIEIGEAIKALPSELLTTEPAIDWKEAGMRDVMAHRYFDTDYAVVEATALEDLPVLQAAVERMPMRIR